MRTQPASFDDNPLAIGAAVKKPPGLARRIGARLLHEAREALPPTIFFFVGFNFIVFTTNLLLADYARRREQLYARHRCGTRRR